MSNDAYGFSPEQPLYQMNTIWKHNTQFFLFLNVPVVK